MDANDKPIEVNVFSHNEFELRGFNDSANGKKWTRGESVRVYLTKNILECEE